MEEDFVFCWQDFVLCYSFLCCSWRTVLRSTVVWSTVVWSTDGCITAALKAVSQHLCDRRIVRALAFYHGWWRIRPKSPVTSQPPSFGRSPVSGRSSYTLFQGALPTALLAIPLRDAVWPLTFMLAHKAVPHECRHLLFTTICSTIPTSPDSGLTSRCGWTAKANPPYEVLGQGHGKGQWVDAHSNYPTSSDRMTRLA